MEYHFKTEPFNHQREEWLRSREEEARAIFWEQGCVDASTEYLSPTGWVRMDQYRGGPVAQWHPESRLIEFVQPLEYVKRPCASMIRIHHPRGLDQLLSPEHRVPFVDRDSGAIRVCSAEDLERMSEKAWRYLPATFRFDGGGSGTGLTEDELRLQVAVMADGHFPSNSPHSRRCYVNLKRKRKIARLDSLLARLGLEHTRKEQPDGFVRYAFQAPLRTKVFDARFWAATAEERAIIADEVGHWDGTITPESVRFYSTLKENADFVQFILASLGRITTLRHDGATWVVHSRSRGENLTVMGSGVSREPSPDGYKYCFMVPSAFLLFRRNGLIFPSGNTGKSKLTIDTACWLYLRGLIDGVLVVAPNGVHRNWVEKEIPDHVPDEVIKHVRAFHYQSPKADTKWHKQAVKAVIEHKGFAWLTISYEAFMTASGKRALIDFFDKRRLLYVLDEAHYIKTPTAERTKSILRSAKYAPFRRVLTGTPIAQGPFDAYSQIKFLVEDYWKQNRLGTFTEFKQHFGVWKKGWNPTAFNPKTKKNDGNEYDVLVGYRRLDDLNALLQPVSSRVTKDDVLDLPPKLYSKRIFPMTPEQGKLYRQLRDEYIVWLETGGIERDAEAVAAEPSPDACPTCLGKREVESDGFIYPCPDCGDAPDLGAEGTTPVIAALAITRLLRLQQITCGYLPTDDEAEPVYTIPGPNRRLDLLCDLIEESQHKVIVWARFQMDITLIMDALRERGISAVRYDGLVNDDERADAKARFQGERPLYHNGQVVGREAVPPEEQARVFVGNPAAGATGLTLTAAKTVIYYSNSFKLIDRLQSEDRAHRIGQTNSVLYIDLVAEDSVDEKVVEALRNKFNVASQITGDRLKDWL